MACITSERGDSSLFTVSSEKLFGRGERGGIEYLQADDVSSAMSFTNDFSLEQLRTKLHKMTDVELRKFMREASEACDAGADAAIKHIVQLQEATAEWRRRKNPKTGNTK
jgi:hypothetical protein